MITTTRNKASSYSAGMVLTGAPIANDVAPTNLASVDPTRRLAHPPGFLLSSAVVIAAFALDAGASGIVVRPWWYDAGTNLWVPNGNVATLVSSAAASTTQVVGYQPGCLYFYQVVSNAGNCTKLFLLLR